ncbi:hypothetical protein CAEBREN_09907 [Caenorhabditis brenneri]|uniref:Uncharacterized protein n=1 Tax=Caenorhabditis brenneri TaxID=135651 RepID=G0MGE1_CAEBE|nr:hypothetical protein CAEBREN_09907 [Caenorhabditis brenneri]
MMWMWVRRQMTWMMMRRRERRSRLSAGVAADLKRAMDRIDQLDIDFESRFQEDTSRVILQLSAPLKLCGMSGKAIGMAVEMAGELIEEILEDYDNNSYTFNGGLDIRRNDGRTATILNSADTEHSKYFQCLMLVWPGWEHNIPEMGVRN